LLENPPQELHERVMKAAKYCPNNVITVLED
jgi:ferredoxin